MRIHKLFSLAAAAGAGALLAGCIDGQRPMQPDYGRAVHSMIAAQTADPEARYRRDVEPAASGDRAFTASDRYEKGAVVQPTIESTR